MFGEMNDQQRAKDARVRIEAARESLSDALREVSVYGTNIGGCGR